MRKPLVALAVLSCFGLLACEDGPTQTFTPVSGNGDSQDGNPNAPGTPATTPGNFNTQGGGQNQMVICDAATEAKIWKSMVQAPMKPPRNIGLIDLAGGDTWQGLTIEAAEKIQCQSANEGDAFGDGTQYNQWGNNGELGCDYNVSNHKIYFCNAWPGYVGTMAFTSRDGAHKYTVPIQTATIQKDSKNFPLDWNLSGFNQNPKFDAELNELYDALIATYAPGLPSNSNCQGTGSCIVGNFGDVAYMFFPALGVGWWIASLAAGQPTCSTINRVDEYLTKTLPYSLANPILKLDAIGPLGPAGTLSHGPAACNLQMGLTFENFTNNCVQVDGSTASNAVENNKLLGGLTHDTESWTFDVQGVDLNFRDQSLGATSIVTDQDMPHATDVAVNFDVDQSTLGVLANDFTNDDPTQPQDWHGAGLVYLEYARLVQENLNQYIPVANQHPLGDPACLWPSSPPPANWAPAPGCTGFEGFITTAPVASTGTCPIVAPATTPDFTQCVNGFGSDNLALGYQALYVNVGLQLGLKPGHPKASFCWDANGNLALDANGNFLPTSGYQNCPLPPNSSGDLISTSYAQVLYVLGGGNVANLPPDVQDVRFFWKQYATALVKYLKVAGTAHENAIDIDERTPGPGNLYTYTSVDSDDLFFDSVGAGQFEIAEYVQRDFASATEAPTDIVFEADVKNGIFDEYSFTRELYRGEAMLYQAVTENAADALGSERTALLTNIFGSPLLASGWTPVAGAAGQPSRSAYYCATTYDPASCQGQTPPLDANGNMLLNDAGGALLSRYEAAFAGNGTAFTLGQAPQPVNITATFDDIQQATVSVPIYSPYFNPGAKNPKIATTLVPWTPKQPGIGFPVALTGTLDKFIETSNVDFSGTTLSASVDYDTAIDPNTGMPATDGSITFLAVETTDFLGDVFVCSAPNPVIPSSQDLLAVRMYTPVATILNWLAQHPGSYQNCGIIVTYSPYDNYADYITSIANGVRLNITQGGGFGRVVDVTLFVPGQ